MASDGRAEDHLGGSVALARAAALLGAPGPPAVGSGAGAAYLFARTNGRVCSVVPVTDCHATWRKGLLLADDREPRSRRIVVRLQGPPPLAQADFGNPLAAGGTAYRLCFYDDAGALVAQATLDSAGASCGGKPCWRPLGGAPPDGIGFQHRGQGRKVRLRAGASSFDLLFKGTKESVSLASRLRGQSRPTVQIVSEDGPACFSFTPSRVVVDGSGVYKAKR